MLKAIEHYPTNLGPPRAICALTIAAFVARLAAVAGVLLNSLIPSGQHAKEANHESHVISQGGVASSTKLGLGAQ